MKSSIKDKLAITRIRIMNFIKEHKYVSLVIGVFLMSAVIALAVRAANDELPDAGNFTVDSVKVALGASSPNTSASVKNFSSASYIVSYRLGDPGCSSADSVDSVIIEATLTNDSAKYVRWNGTTEEALSQIDGNKLKLTIPSVQMCNSTTQALKFTVLNAKKNNPVSLSSLTLQPGSGASVVNLLTTTDSSKHADLPAVTTTYDDNKKLDGSLLAKAVSGAAIKNGTGRDAKYGIMLGFYSDQFQDIMNDITTLEGSYISDEVDIYMSASETTTSGTNPLNISKTSGTYGVYTSEIAARHYFPDLPVLSSGSVGTLSDNELLVSQEESSETNKAPAFALLSSKLTYEKHASQTFAAQKIFIDGELKDCNAANKCTFETAGFDLTAESTGTVSYKVTNDNGSTTLIQDIEVVAPQDESNVLRGPKTVYVINNYNDYGLINVEAGSKFYKVTDDTETLLDITDFNAYISSGDKSGKYKQKYVVGETEVATRTIVVDETKFTSDEIEVTRKSVAKQNEVYSGSDLKIGSADFVKCNNSSNCSSSLTANDYKTTGDKNVTYTITKSKQEIKINKIIDVEPTYYKLPISGLTLSDELQVKNVDGRTFFVIGTYFVTVPTSSETSNIKFSAFTKTQETPSEATTDNKKDSTGNNLLTNDIKVYEEEQYETAVDDTKSGLSGNYYTAAIGEQIEVNTVYNYGSDADGDMTNFKLVLDINSTYLNPIAINSDSNTPYYTINFIHFGEELDIPIEDITINYCDDSTCITPAEYDSSEHNISRIELSINHAIPAGTRIELKTDYVIKTITDAANIVDKSFNTTAHVSFKSGNIDVPSTGINTVSSKNVYLTPYKVRTQTYLGKGEDIDKTDITLDASKNDIYTLYSTTSVTAPAMILNSNIFGYDQIPAISIKFKLPKGINYVYNADYEMQPNDINGVVRDSAGNTILTYTYQGVEPNTWMESIRFDFNIDVSIPDNSNLKITTELGDWTTNNITNDLSSSSKDKYRESNVRVLNKEEVAHGQYAYNKDQTQIISSIDKNESFVVKTKVYNNQASTINNVNVYTVLPYIDADTEAYHGTYSVDFPTGVDVSCSSSAPSEIASNAAGVSWSDCSTLKESGNLTAVRVTYPTVTAGETKEAAITINTSNNDPDDTYIFKSYITYDGLSEQKSFKNLSVSVISKKITGVVWEDFNDNGVLEPSEKRIENVLLGLFTKEDDLVEITTPDKNGVYTFSGFTEGDYYIVATYDTDKYALTTSLESYPDMSKVSVFKNDITSISDPDNSTVRDIESQMLEENGTGEEGDLNDDPSDDLDDDPDDDPSDDPDDDPSDESGDDGSGSTNPDEEEDEPIALSKTNIITVTADTRTISNMNLGLSLRKKFQVKLNKYITRAEVTNALGLVTRRDYGNAKLAKLDVKDINNLTIKVVYTIEIENIKYYPGYIKAVTETIPDGMSFNESYAENQGWFLNEDGTLTNVSLANELLEEGQKKYLTIAFDVTRKEAGSFINTASVDDLEILGGATDEEE